TRSDRTYCGHPCRQRAYRARVILQARLRREPTGQELRRWLKERWTERAIRVPPRQMSRRHLLLLATRGPAELALAGQELVRRRARTAARDAGWGGKPFETWVTIKSIGRYVWPRRRSTHDRSGRRTRESSSSRRARGKTGRFAGCLRISCMPNSKRTRRRRAKSQPSCSGGTSGGSSGGRRLRRRRGLTGRKA